jgi:Dickkopf N-terminal cysteine-rich region
MRQSLAMLLACAMSSSCLLSDEDGDGTNYVGVTEIEDAYKDAQCAYLAACGVFPDKAACLGAELSTSFGADPQIAAAVFSGHVIYNGTAAKQCIDAIALQSCDRTSETARVTPPQCELFFRGTLGDGEGCYLDQECVSQRCTGDAGETCSLGTCIGDTPPATTRVQINEDCFSGLPCVDGAFCDSLTGLCTALKPMSSTCTNDGECTYGLACVGTAGNRTCGSLPAIGQPCATKGTYCDFNLDACKQVAVSGVCTSSSQCSPYYPCDFNTAPNNCVRGPAVGQPCDSSRRCFDAGTFCDFNVGMCAAMKADGEACNATEECSTGFCDFNQSVPRCTAPTTCF